MISDKNTMKVVVDFGNAKIKIMASQLEDNEIKVIGYTETPVEGLKKSIIEDQNLLSECLKKGLTELEEKIWRKIDKVVLGISSPNIKSRTINKKIEFEEVIISDKEIDLLYQEAGKDIVPLDETILNKEFYNIRVDNSGILKTPKGVLGHELHGDVHILSLNSDELDKYKEIVKKIGFSVETIRLNVCGSAQAVLDSEEKLMGVSLIDIGEGITDIIMYKNGKMIYSKSIPLGGMHYINDLSYILEITKEEAHDILRKLKSNEITNEKIIIDDEKYFTVTYIRNIIDARTEDIVNFIKATLDESGFNGYLGKGIVATGGAIVIDELSKKISQSLNYKVLKKQAQPLIGLDNINTSMSSVIGITLLEHKKLKEELLLKDKKGEIFLNEELKDKKINLNEKTKEKIGSKKGLEVRPAEKLDDLEKKNETEKIGGLFNKFKEIISNYI